MAMDQRRSRPGAREPLTRRQGLQLQALLPLGALITYLTLPTLARRTRLTVVGGEGVRASFSLAQRVRVSGIQEPIRPDETEARRPDPAWSRS